MRSLDRRDFLRHSFAVATSSYAAPSVLAGFFAGQDPTQPATPTREDLLRVAWQRAREEGKPLLVLVVPAEAAESWIRGERLGALLNHGGRSTLLELAACVVACGTLADVRSVTGAAGLATEPLLLLVGHTDAPSPPEATAIHPQLPPEPEYSGGDGTQEDAVRQYEKFVKADEDWARGCNERITTALRRALHGDGKRIPDLARRVRERLPKESLAALQRWLGGGAVPDDALLVRCTAIVRESARLRTDESGSAALDAVAAAAERVLVRRRVPGSKWASGQGCGVSVELEAGEKNDNLAVACGMGRVPALSQRFLLFYSNS